MQSEANKIADKIDEIIVKNPDMEYSKKVNDLKNLQRFILDKMRGSRIPLHNKENEEKLRRKSVKIMKKAKKSGKESMKGGKRSRKVKGKRSRKGTRKI
jgi:hypothetical protein